MDPRTAKVERVEWDRRNRDLDPQLVWRGKEEQDEAGLATYAPPLFIQEKIHPKVLIDDLIRESAKRRRANAPASGRVDLFADFNGLPESVASAEFYQHDSHWSNRFILGDSLQVMTSLAEREDLAGKVQCVYFDPPYGIKFNSNFQWSTANRDVTDGKAGHITREPEQVKAFRDTWRDGIHSYLSYLRDRLTVARELLTESGSVFVQIGSENVHRVRVVMDEVFGDDNCVSQITFQTTTSSTTVLLSQTANYLLWYAKDKKKLKFRDLLFKKEFDFAKRGFYNKVRNKFGKVRKLTGSDFERIRTGKENLIICSTGDLTSDGAGSRKEEGDESGFYVEVNGTKHWPSSTTHWKTNEQGMARLKAAGRIVPSGKGIRYLRFWDDFPATRINEVWTDVVSVFSTEKIYVVQTNTAVIRRIMLMCTDPGDLVLDPTCGSGTTAYVAEQWGRRWIAIDTSRVAIALARSRLMGARYPYYVLKDSQEGLLEEARIARREPRNVATHKNVAHGFVCERIPHVILGDIASNAEIDVIDERYEKVLSAALEELNAAAHESWREWEVPEAAEESWPDSAKQALEEYWKLRAKRLSEMDASIAAKAKYEILRDSPCVDKSKVRVAGPFTVESLSPHRMAHFDENGDVVDPAGLAQNREGRDFNAIIRENLLASGVQQSNKDDKIVFVSLEAWPGEMICAYGRYLEGEKEKRVAVFIGPEFGSVRRPDLVKAAKEAAEGGFDALLVCAFSYDAYASEASKIGCIPILMARMNAELHMAESMKKDGKGNLFVLFGEPDVEIRQTEDGQYQVEIKGVDVFAPNSGEIRSDGTEDIACWFVDTDYNEESFFVRQAYFPVLGDAFKKSFGDLQRALKAEVDKEAWESLNRCVSRPFDKPQSGRIAVKAINHFGDEVMRVYKVE